MEENELIKNLINKRKEAPPGTYTFNGAKFIVTKNEIYDTSNSFIKKSILFLKWITSNSFDDLSNYSGAKYHLLLNLTQINKGCSLKRIESLCKSHSSETPILEKVFCIIMSAFQKLIYLGTGYQQVALLKNINGVSGELLKKDNEKYIAYHSNKIDNLQIRGEELLFIR